MKVRASNDMIGSSSGEQRIRWDERDAILYAVGIGAGLDAPERELAFTTENSGGIELRAVPSFLTVLAQKHRPPALAMLDADQFLHGEQSIELLRPLPAAAEGFVYSVVDAVLDKGADAIVSIVTSLYADDSQRSLIGRSRMSIFVRGAGGFGGARGAADSYVLPDRAPDMRISYCTRPERALLYRLSGDRNRLHSDPEFARAHGFRRPILHGLCTYGFGCRALIETVCGGDPSRLLAMRGRFRHPVYPGDTLTSEIWRNADGEILFQILDGSGNVAFGRGSAAVAG